MKEYYIWDNIETAQACLNYVNSSDKFPITGKNSSTKEEATDKQKFTMWAKAVKTFTGGKFGFPRIPETTLDAMGVTHEERETFLATFNPQILPYDYSWVPEIEP